MIAFIKPHLVFNRNEILASDQKNVMFSTKGYDILDP